MKKIGKGNSSEISLLENASGKKLVAKIEKEKSTRINIFDLEKRVIFMEFVDGIQFGKWVFRELKKSN